MKKHLITVILLINSFMGFSQVSLNCIQSLEELEQSFEQGRLSDIISKYDDGGNKFIQCLEENGFSILEKIRAYKLLTKSFLFQDNKEMAERMFVELSKIDKEHQLLPEDPAELYILKEEFKTDPVVRIAVRGGVNKSIPSIIQNFDTSQEKKKYNEAGTETGLGIGFWGEVLFEKYLIAGIEIGGGFQYRIITYETEGEIVGQELKYITKNNSSTLRFPLVLRYSFNYNKQRNDGKRKGFLPYIFVGSSYDILLSAKYIDSRRTGGTAYTLTENSTDIKSKDQVATSNISVMMGAGARFRVGRSKVDFISIELRYDKSLFNHTNPENRWENVDAFLSIGNVEDDLLLNAVSFSIGYTRSFYAPRKRKRYR